MNHTVITKSTHNHKTADTTNELCMKYINDLRYTIQYSVGTQQSNQGHNADLCLF